jgi:glycosyltransferase involved in cell wall biosynthesis
MTSSAHPVNASLRDLTIVVATYRSEAFIEHTIASALACRPAMIIVSDDGSADSTLDIVLALSEQTDIPIRIHRSKVRRGLTRNWNWAIAQVPTTFCLKLDHDDLIIPTYARAAIEYLRQHETVGIIAGFAYEVVDPFGTEALSRVPSARAGVARFESIAACRAILRWSPYSCSSSTIYRTTKFHAVGGFDSAMSFCNDREIWFRMAREGPIAQYGGPGAVVRLHDNNFTKEIRSTERIPFEFEHMFRRAAAIWPETELRADFARAFRSVARNYAGSAIRIALRKPKEVPIRLLRSGVLLLKSLTV